MPPSFLALFINESNRDFLLAFLDNKPSQKGQLFKEKNLSKCCHLRVGPN